MYTVHEQIRKERQQSQLTKKYEINQATSATLMKSRSAKKVEICFVQFFLRHCDKKSQRDNRRVQKKRVVKERVSSFHHVTQHVGGWLVAFIRHIFAGWKKRAIQQICQIIEDASELNSSRENCTEKFFTLSAFMWYLFYCIYIVFAVMQ